MSTLQEVIDRRAGAWVAWVEIAGLGDSNGPYRFCTQAPAFAAADPNWRAMLRDLPDEIPQDVDLEGGIERAGVLDFTLVDVDDFLTDLLRFDAAPIGELIQDLDRTTPTFFVRNGAGFAADQAIHIGGETMTIDSVDAAGTPGQLTVTRGALGTLALDHPIQSLIRGWVRRLHGREVLFYLAPFDADDIDERIDLGTFYIRKLAFSSDFTGWRIKAASAVLGLKRRVGKALEGHSRTTYSFGGGKFSLERVGGPRTLIAQSVWTSDNGRAYFRLDDREIAIGLSTGIPTGTAIIDQVVLERRGALGTAIIDVEAKHAEDGGVKVTRPLIAETADGLGSFRYIPTSAADQEDRADPAVVQSDHWVDICLCLLTSSRRAEDELELTNYAAGEPNWSTLPVGMGAGVRASRLDFPAWRALKARTPRWRFPGFLLDDPAEAGELITKYFLRPLGVFLVTHAGKIRPVLPRLPFEGLTAPALDHTTLLSSPAPFQPALISGGYDATVEKKAVQLTARDPAGEEVKVLITSGDFAGAFGDDDEPGPEDVLEIDLPGVRTNNGAVTAFFEEVAARRLFRLSRPQQAFEAQADLERRDVELGGLIALTFDAVPNPRTGTRGVTDAILTVLGKSIDLDLQAPGFRFKLLGYGGGVAVGLVGPSALIVGWDGGTNTASLGTNLYTADDADVLDLPPTDAEQFRAGMVLKLINQDGTDAHVTTQVVQADGAADAVQLDGDFGVGGGNPTGLIMVLADYAAARTEDQDTYAAFADRATRTVGASSREPWTHGEQ